METQTSENPRVVVGGNNPPEPSKLDPFREYYRSCFPTAQRFKDHGVNSQDEANELEAFDKLLRTYQKRAEAVLKDERAPFDAKLKELREMYGRVIDGFGTLRAAVGPARTAWLQKEQARIDAEKQAAFRVAEEARLKAAEEAAAAKASGDLLAAEKAAEADQDAQHAEKAAKAAATTKARAGGGTTTSRSASLKTFTTYAIDDATAALKFFSLKGQKEYHPLFEAVLEKAVRAYRKDNPGVDVPGVTVTTEQKAV